MKVWLCPAKVMVPPPKKVKIGLKIIDRIFIRYANNRAAYQFFVHKSDIPDIHINTIIKSMDVLFFENLFPSKNIQEEKTIRRANGFINNDP